MSTITKKGTATQTTGGKYAKFDNIKIIEDYNNGWATTALIKGSKETPNRPSTITMNKFNFNLPVGAQVNSIRVEIKHMKQTSNGQYAQINSPTITLMNGSKPITVTGKKGNYTEKFNLAYKGLTPPIVEKTMGITFGGTHTSSKKKNTKLSYNVPQRETLNSNNFGVKIDYPANTSNRHGYLRVAWVRVTVNYTESQYVLSNQITYGGTDPDGKIYKAGAYNHDEYRFKLKINRNTKTSHIPKVTITTPVGFTYKGAKGGGTVKQIEAHTLEWTPNLSKNNTTSSSNTELSFQTEVTFPSGVESEDFQFECTENLHGNSTINNVKVIPSPTSTSTESDTTVTVDSIDLPPSDYHIVTQNEAFNFIFKVTDAEWEEYFTGHEHDRVYWFTPLMSNTDAFFYEHFTNEHTIEINTHNGFTDYGIQTMSLLSENSTTGERETVKTYYFNVIPSTDNLTTCHAVYYQPDNEEIDRLGDGHSYTIQSFLKLETEETYIRDWGKNFRIGVFNNYIPDNITYEEVQEEDTTTTIPVDNTDYSTLTLEQIFKNAEYWSNSLTHLNTWENIEVSFMYDKDYPLYIIITGDYEEGKPYNNKIKYTEPCIIETTNYTSYEAHGNYPYPINNLLSTDNLTSDVTLERYGKTNTFTISELITEDSISTTENTAIRGIEITGDIASTDELILYATLQSPQNGTGERSIIIPENSTSFSIGGNTDLWGFNIQELINLEDWDITFSISNNLNEDTASINFGSLTVNIYTETVDQQNITCTVNDENLAYYGAFITKLNIPPSLKTEVDYISIDGTDTNEAYRQNITEKTIEIDFTIGDTCDLETNTTSLREITRLLTNDRDSLNRPIPNRIEFSHQPDVYYEYIIHDSFNTELDITQYTVKAKLIVPAGTAYSKETTTTNTNGVVQGLANVNPVIIVKPVNTPVEITETLSNQKWSINYPKQWNDKILEIDCENRICWLKTNEENNTDSENINEYVDWNSDWFTLKGEYQFQSNNCIIRTVEYLERW